MRRPIGSQGTALYALAWLAGELIKSTEDRLAARRERKALR